MVELLKVSRVLWVIRRVVFELEDIWIDTYRSSNVLTVRHLIHKHLVAMCKSLLCLVYSIIEEEHTSHLSSLDLLESDNFSLETLLEFQCKFIHNLRTRITIFSNAVIICFLGC